MTVNSLHPATYMNTTMVREGGITPISRSSRAARRSCIWPIGDDVAGKSGLFFNGMQPAQGQCPGL